MTEGEARRWARSAAADLLYSDMQTGRIYDYFDDKAVEMKKKAAMEELIAELRAQEEVAIHSDAHDSENWAWV